MHSGSLCTGVMESGVMEPLLLAMEAMSDHDDLIQSSCWILSSLAFATDGEH